MRRNRITRPQSDNMDRKPFGLRVRVPRTGILRSRAEADFQMIPLYPKMPLRGVYMFPVNRRMTLITVPVTLEIKCDTKPRSTPNWEPNIGRTIRSPIRMTIP